MINKFKILIVLIVIFIFVYLRITPIINQTVPYTYDQGRDFLKIEEIFRDKNITFIGPTTGIQGVYHGVWWYYFLIIPYLLFSGWPQGFYFFLFFINLLVNLFIYKYLEKNYSFASGLFFLSIISISTFFIRTAFFASNNNLTPLFVVLFIYSLYQVFKTKKSVYLFLTGLSLGFIFETEMALGLFIIPSFLIIYFLYSKFKNLPVILSGLAIPIIPRILFELKNNFSQTKSFFSYLTSGKLEHSVQFIGLIQERLMLFWENWKSIFYQESYIMAVLFILLLSVLLILRNKLKDSKKTFINFLVLLLILIFAFSLLVKNGFFWNYYIDGIQYIFVMLLVSSFYLLEKNKKTLYFAYFLLTLIVFLNLFAFIKDINNKKSIPLIGLRADDSIVKYILEKNKNENFCLKIYTPPVFPFTYRYLFDYHTKKISDTYLMKEPVNNQCWYIIDYDDDKERVNDWKKKNIPTEGKLIKSKIFDNKTVVELWSI